MDAAERIIVALDTDVEQARLLALRLRDRAHWLKVGMTLYYAVGQAIVAEFKEMGYKVFVDLKIHDIPHQARGATRAVVAAGADMLTVHAAGGSAMMQAAYQGAEEGFATRALHLDFGEADYRREQPICLAITVLTSLDSDTLASIGVYSEPASQALRLAYLARNAGMDGIVCSPEETAAIRQEFGRGFVMVTPGVRPEGAEQGDQLRIATPKLALEAGADYLVIGRPITEAADPLAAFEAIAEEME